MPISFRRKMPPLTEAELKLVEERLGRALPGDYADFLRANNGAVPESNCFPIPGPAQKGGIVEFFSAGTVLEEAKREDCWDAHVVIPIASAECGNRLLLALDGGEVYFWDHEFEGAEALTRVAQSFRAFMEALEPFDASQVTLDPDDIISAWIDPDLLK